VSLDGVAPDAQVAAPLRQTVILLGLAEFALDLVSFI